MNMRRGIGVGAAVLAGLAVAFFAWVYGASEAHYRSFPAPPRFEHPIPSDPASLALGERIAKTRGCGGCHGADLEGEIMMGLIETPNLVHEARDHDAAELEAAIRHGIGDGGRALYSMPSYNFMRMTDADVAALIGHLQNAPMSEAPPAGKLRPWPERALHDFVTRFNIAIGADGAMPRWLPQVPELTEQANANPAIARGEYLAMTSCNECHGFDLRGYQPWGGPPAAPDLISIAAYSKEDFTRLMREGVPTSGAELEMMGPVARGRFVHWTDEEVDALYAYLSHASAQWLANEQ